MAVDVSGHNYIQPPPPQLGEATIVLGKKSPQFLGPIKI